MIQKTGPSTFANVGIDTILPSQAGKSGQFLTTNGTTSSWAAVSGSGTVTTVSVATANGFSGSVANATTTPAITIVAGAITPTSVNGLTISATTGTLTVTGSKIVTFSNTLTFAGTDSTTMTFPTTSATVARTDASNTFTGHQTIEGVTSTGATGTGLLVFATSPALTTASLGSSTATTQSQLDGSTKVSTTAYVDTAVSNAIAGVNPAIAVQCATTAAGDTSSLTYLHVAGIGDTFTGAVNTAITIDGHTLVLNDRVLIKNDTQTSPGAVSAGTFNGVYLVTTIQTGIVAPVLTRAIDYDTPSDINNTGAIPVVLGTANASTSWILTSSVAAVGTGSNALTYSQFSLAPSSIVTLTGSQALTNKTYNGNTFTAGTGTLTIAAAKTLTASNTLTLAGTDSTTITFQATDTYVGRATTDTLTNKRITRRTTTVTQSATPTINTDNMDVAAITGLAQAITSMTTNLTGTPSQNDLLEIQITDNATARAITWGASFSNGGLVNLPTTTVLSVELRVLLEWDATTKWTCVAVA